MSPGLDELRRRRKQRTKTFLSLVRLNVINDSVVSHNRNASQRRTLNKRGNMEFPVQNI